MVSVNPEASLKWACSQYVKPSSESHKGQNGRLLVIGGSHIFHSASLWSAEIASHFVDLVHYSSTAENLDVFTMLKSKFTNGIIVPKEKLLEYMDEDDCILIGPGMERGDISPELMQKTLTFPEIVQLTNEADYTYALIRYLLQTYPDKKYVLDAAALQVSNPNWFRHLKTKPIVTPHMKEFSKLFGIHLEDIQEQELQEKLTEIALKYSCIILLKHITDYVSDGTETITIVGGNAGLTKGGTGDALAGLTAALNTKLDQVSSCILASYLVKSTAEKLYDQTGLNYNTSDLIASIPACTKGLLY